MLSQDDTQRIARKRKIKDVDCIIFENIRRRRIDLNQFPEFPHVYDCRHSDQNHAQPVTIEHGVMVNFWGTILAAKPLLKENERYIELPKRLNR